MDIFSNKCSQHLSMVLSHLSMVFILLTLRGCGSMLWQNSQTLSRVLLTKNVHLQNPAKNLESGTKWERAIVTVDFCQKLKNWCSAPVHKETHYNKQNWQRVPPDRVLSHLVLGVTEQCLSQKSFHFSKLGLMLTQ